MTQNDWELEQARAIVLSNLHKYGPNARFSFRSEGSQLVISVTLNEKCRFQYVGTAGFLLERTAIGNFDENGQFCVLVDEPGHPWSYRWQPARISDWKPYVGDLEIEHHECKMLDGLCTVCGRVS